MPSRNSSLSPSDLERYNGRDEPAVYVAYEGKVYDVSESRFWKSGTHMQRHPSGRDLTGELKGAPHGPEVLERFARVGTLEPAGDPMDEKIPDFLLRLFRRVPMLRRHPHPMTVHFPLVFNLTFPLFNVLYVLTRYEPFEKTAFHMLILCVPSMLVAMTTGLLTWWWNYGARMSPNIRVKLAVSPILLVLVLIALAWRIHDPEILTAPGLSSLLYLGLSCALAVLVGVLGWFGAQMTFPA